MVNPTNPHPISFLDDPAFAAYDPAQGRLDKVIDGVTISAIPDGSGGTQWEAKTAGGESVPLFHVTMRRPPASGIAAPFKFVDTTTGCYVCYEDHIRMQSICLSAPC